MTNPTPLSPAAQAVWDAYSNASDGEYVEGVWIVDERTMLAAALAQPEPEGPTVMEQLND